MGREQSNVCSVSLPSEQQAASKIIEVWIASWGSFPNRQYPTDSSSLHKKLKLKQRKHMDKIGNSKLPQFAYRI